MNVRVRTGLGGNADPRGGVGRGRLILHVEDDGDLRQLYSAFLRRAGFRVAGARNGVEGFERALELRPDLVMMDLAMPGTDGFEATRRLKKTARTSRIPVLILSAYGYRAHLHEAAAAGADAFLLKPVTSEELVRRVDELLSIAALTQPS